MLKPRYGHATATLLCFYRHAALSYFKLAVAVMSHSLLLLLLLLHQLMLRALRQTSDAALAACCKPRVLPHLLSAPPKTPAAQIPACTGW